MKRLVLKSNGKKSLKIPKGRSSEAVNERTDNTMTKRKKIKGQTLIYKTL
jgi:hypothetical protein